MKQLNDYKTLINQSITKSFDKVPDLLFKSVSKYIADKGDYPSSSKLIRSNSGRLLKSLQPGNVDNLYSLVVSNGNIKITYGTKVPYALIHEEGGTITSKGKMHKYFWAMYYKTKQNYYKNLAIRVSQGKSLKIPKRPFLKPGIEDFNEKYLPKIVDEFVANILNK